MEAGQAPSKQRALELLKTKTGFKKWYQRGYGYPLDSSKFKVLPVRPLTNFEGTIQDLIASDAMGSQEMCVCTLKGLSVTTFSEALGDIAAPPVLMISKPFEKTNYVLCIEENNELWFSQNLWTKLCCITGMSSERLIEEFATR